MHKFDPQHIVRLLRDERLREIGPERLLIDAGLKRGDTFLDVGSGPGFFTFPAAGIVGAGGKVYAIDTQEEMLEGLGKRNPPPNVAMVRSGESSIPLDDSLGDLALCAYVLHETEDKTAFLKEIKRILKKGAKLVIIDWKKKTEEKGPPASERLTEQDAGRHMEEAGFTGMKTASLNESHYIISAIK